MAYIADTAFEVKITNHEYDSLANITGKFQNGGVDEICSAGFLCKRDALIDNEGYSAAGIKNTNTWNMVAATASDLANDGIYACNTFNVNELADPVTGAVYKVGSNTLGLPAPAGELVTYTRIRFDGESVYRFGIGNASGALGDNTFFTVADGLLAPAAAAPSSGNGTPYFELVRTGAFTQGAYAGMDFVDVRACQYVG